MDPVSHLQSSAIFESMRASDNAEAKANSGMIAMKLTRIQEVRHCEIEIAK